MPSIPYVFLKALVLYAATEAQSGHADQIHIFVSADGFIVQDNGRGHSPTRTVGTTPYLKFIYQQIELPSFATADQQIQLQGIGTSIISSLCPRLLVTSLRDGLTPTHEYRYGLLVSHSQDPYNGSTTGNIIKAEFELTEPGPSEEFSNWLANLASLIPACHFSIDGHAIPRKNQSSVA